jgi:hypothetical protein
MKRLVILRIFVDNNNAFCLDWRAGGCQPIIPALLVPLPLFRFLTTSGDFSENQKLITGGETYDNKMGGLSFR